jgi:hypothetical protein
MEVFERALGSALSAGATEIGVDTLLLAIDEQSGATESVGPATGPIVPVEKQELPLSPEAAAVVSSLGDMFRIRLDALRSALLASKRGE